jgi:hypothetical protein
VGAEAIVDIHDTDSSVDPLIEFARSSIRLASGTIVVADQYARRLRFFDGSGVPVRVVGGEGRGPGEFVDSRWLSQCGTDSLFVWDYTRRSILVFDTAGSYAREYRPRGQPHEVRCDRRGRFGMLGLPVDPLPPSVDGGIVL